MSKVQKAWRVNRTDDDTVLDSPDLEFIRMLIIKMKEKYAIDPERIFMQGMSMGDLITLQFVRLHGNILAGAACVAGPVQISTLFNDAGKVRRYLCPVPVFQSRGEHDSVGGHEQRFITNQADLDYWLRINGCESDSCFEIHMDDNIIYFEGHDGDVIFRDVKRRGHGQTFDDADVVWRRFFSGLRKAALAIELMPLFT